MVFCGKYKAKYFSQGVTQSVTQSVTTHKQKNWLILPAFLEIC